MWSNSLSYVEFVTHSYVKFVTHHMVCVGCTCNVETCTLTHFYSTIRAKSYTPPTLQSRTLVKRLYHVEKQRTHYDITFTAYTRISIIQSELITYTTRTLQSCTLVKRLCHVELALHVIQKCVRCYGIQKCVRCYVIQKCVRCYVIQKCVRCFVIQKCVPYFALHVEPTCSGLEPMIRRVRDAFMCQVRD